MEFNRECFREGSDRDSERSCETNRSLLRCDEPAGRWRGVGDLDLEDDVNEDSRRLRLRERRLGRDIDLA